MLEAAIISLIICIGIYRLEPLRGLLEDVITRISHNKSAVSIIIVGLVAGKAPTISHSIGGLFDINITTSIKVEFMTFDVEKISILMASIGAVLFGTKKKTLRQTGMGVFGLAVGIGAIFGHMTLASVLGDMEWMGYISTFLHEHLVYAAIIGAIIRSRKIALGVAAVFVAMGQIQLDTAVMIFLGAYVRMLLEPWFARRK